MRLMRPASWSLVAFPRLCMPVARSPAEVADEVRELAPLRAFQARKNRSEECDLATRVEPDLRGSLARAPRRALRADREARVGPEF
jgi:hypothetical protein